MKKIYRFVISLVIILLFAALVKVDMVNAESCYTVTPKITDAVEQYLTEMYIEKYPDMGLEFTYGSAADQKVLETLADKITADITKEEDMTLAIAQWTNRNIKYKSAMYGTNIFPMDVFYERMGNCVGYAQLMSQLMRLKGIPAVICSGIRGDMADYLTVETIKANELVEHAWVMAYFDGQWHLYDPLYGEYNVTDKDYISKWYLTTDMEGIAPYYEGMDLLLIREGYAIYYIDGRFINHAAGIPASEYYGMCAQGGTSVNLVLSYFSLNKYLNEDGIHDGYEYVENPERKEEMINDECYSNGWLTYGAEPSFLARPNGILTANTIRQTEDKLYFFSFAGGGLILEGESEDYTLTQGYVTLEKGKTITIMPPFYESELESGKVIVWGSETPDIATIDQNGLITGVSEGFGTLTVRSKDTVDGDTHYSFAYIEIYVTESGVRVPDYEDHPISQDEIDSSVNSGETGDSDDDGIGAISVDYNARGGFCNVSGVTILQGQAIGKLAKPTKKGYAFLGWYTKKSGGKKVTAKTTFHKSTVIYARWEKISVGKGKTPKLTNKKSKKLTIQFKKVTGAQGYQIEYSTDKNFKSSTKKLVKDLKATYKVAKGKTYYVRVRAYKKDSGGSKVYGKWSKVVSKKIKK